MLLLVLLRAAHATETLFADDVRLHHSGDSVQLTAVFCISDLHVGRDDVWLITPRLVNGADSLDLPSLGLYGRIPYIYLKRSGLYLFQDSTDVMLTAREAERGVVLDYARSVVYRPWLEGAEVKLEFTRISCCGDIRDANSWRILSQQQLAVPDSIVRHPYTESRGGVAHVDFIVNRTELRPDYHDNRRELGKISGLIDSLEADGHVHIDTVTLHGYASPEGPYDNNVRLARGRVRTLADYLRAHHDIDSAIVSLQFTPEDWAGLRRYVDASALPNREAIIAVIDDTLAEPDPDRRLAIIKRRYPRDYAVIAAESLPYLRHTDYTISYHTDKFTTEVIPGYAYPKLPVRPADPPTPPRRIGPLRPLFAAKTNLLFDLALWPNAEVEVPLGRDARWSIMAEWGSPWYVWHHNSRAYEILNVGLEGRRWFGRCDGCRPVLSGAFAGVYACVGKFDLEWHSHGNQGEYVSLGFSGGYSWPLRKCLNLELSGTLGTIFGKRRYYDGEFNDTHLIWKHFGRVFYVGPTQLKVSLVWLIPRKWFGLGE